MHNDDTLTFFNQMTMTSSPAPVPTPVPAATGQPPANQENAPIYYSHAEPGKEPVFIGGRKSKLAVVQTQLVASTLEKAFAEKSFPVLAISTLGDQQTNKPLYSFGGKALWTQELETLLLEGKDGHKLDMVVHSLKDMPTNLPPKCSLGAITKREDPRDALIMPLNSPYKTLADLPEGAVVGTSSIRRSAQLKRRYPNLKFEDIRGSINTRLAKLDDPESKYSCTILAAAGLIRIGLQKRITAYLEGPEMYHAVGQGALGVETREGDFATQKLLNQVVNHLPTSLCCHAERSLMRTLEGGCSVPIGVSSSYDEDTQTLKLSGIVVSVDGSEAVEDTVTGTATTDREADELGQKLASVLVDMGAKRILDAIHLESV